MKAYDCDYTWEEVKDATNRCLQVIYQKEGDIVENLFDNTLPTAMNTVARYCFTHGKYFFSFHDLYLIKMAYQQVDTVGYIGKASAAPKMADRKNK